MISRTKCWLRGLVNKTQPCAVCETTGDIETVRLGWFPNAPGRPFVCSLCRLNPKNFAAIEAAATLAHKLGWFL